MNFFEQQDEAKRLSKRLVLYFLIAVIVIIVSLILVITTVLDFTLYEKQYAASNHLNYFEYLFSQHKSTMGWVSLGSIALIGGISLIRTLTLRQGGQVVAEWAGARQIDYDTQDYKEKQLLNIVDEMSIASGVPRPGVYIMDEELAINAFAAGYSSNNAVIAVTRGTLEQLSRNELQGVVAHEFSHILNGDMRLNIRLMGVLAGILFIGSIGLLMMRSVMFTRRRSRDNNGVLAVIAIGLAITVIGFVGVFCGRIIRAAVSRQREYLADASAVQFTRNPDGIANALNKIRLLSAGSTIENKRAEEMSHMYFGEAVSISLFSGMLASHPPLPERIKRINPQFDLEDDLIETAETHAPQGEETHAAMSGFSSATTPTESVIESTGTFSDDQIEYGKEIHALFPAAIMHAMKTETNLLALLYALMLDNSAGYRQQQLDLISSQGETAIAVKAADLYQEVRHLDAKSLLPLFTLVLPELRRQIQVSSMQNIKTAKKAKSNAYIDAACSAILITIEKMITIDDHISIKEFIYLLAVDSCLNPKANQAIRTKYKDLNPIANQAAMLIALMAISGHDDQDMQKQAYNAGINAAMLGSNSNIQLNSFSYEECRNALYKMKQAKPLAKEKLMTALVETALSDETITMEEFDLLRTLAMALECPIPPNLSI